MAKGTARQAALEALEKCRRSGAWSSASIDGVIKKYELDRRDAALASRLCLGVLQNSACLDYYIALYCSRSLSDIEPKLRDILRLGAYQLLYMDKIPPSAAVNESVALCALCGARRAAGLINAVLRRLSENAGKLPDIPGRGSAEYLSTKYSHPAWLINRIMERHGYEFTEAFLAENNRPAPITVQINTLKISAADYKAALAAEGVEFSEDKELGGCLQIAGGSVTALPGFSEGLFYVQDKAARLAVCAAEPRPGISVLDLCSAPGGKSFAAAIAMENQGSIISCDIHENKLKLIRTGGERLGIDIITAMQRDARIGDSALDGRFDLVIADVPCSGFGVIRKKPEIRLKSENEISALPVIQKEILCNAAGFVKPGGTLLYSTCTVLPEENEMVVEAFLKENAAFEPCDFSACGAVSKNGMYTFWPHIDRTDGFFAAKLKRKN